MAVISKRLLLIEDSRFFLAPMQACLRSAGCIVISTFDHGEVLPAALSLSPDLIVLHMMAMQSFEVLRALKINRSTRRIPVVLMAMSRFRPESHEGVAILDLLYLLDLGQIRRGGCLIARQRPGTAHGFTFLCLNDEQEILDLIGPGPQPVLPKGVALDLPKTPRLFSA